MAKHKKSPMDRLGGSMKSRRRKKKSDSGFGGMALFSGFGRKKSDSRMAKATARAFWSKLAPTERYGGDDDDQEIERVEHGDHEENIIIRWVRDAFKVKR